MRLAAAATIALAAALPAQRQFDQLHALPWGADICMLGDVDGDGDLDIVSARWGQNRLYLNDGAGNFIDATATRMPVDSHYTTSVALGDVDADGDLDIVFGNAQPGFAQLGERNLLYLNDGTGHFIDVTLTNMPADADPTAAVVLGDVDGDGDLDLVCANNVLWQFWDDGFGSFGGDSFGQPNRLYVNDANGRFVLVAMQLPHDGDPTTAAAMGDVDGDGDLDIVFANGHVASYSCSGQPPFPGCAQVTQGRPDRLYLNDGVGSFTVAPVTQMPGSWDCAASVALGDVDGDGDLDIVFGNDRASYESGYGPLLGGLISSASGHENHLFLNDGNGVFSYAAQLPVDASVTGAVAFADVDGDGDLDLVCANDDPGHSRLYVNDGTGTFGDGTAARMPTGGASRSLAAGDVDHDGDPDLVTAGRLYTNLLRQLHAPSAPQVGQPYLLDAYSRYGPPAVFDVAVVVLSTNRVSVPVSPFGLLGVEPMLQLPAVVIPQPAGVGTVAWTPPNVPGMVGMPLYSQALVVPWPFDARLTNVVGGVVQ